MKTIDKMFTIIKTMHTFYIVNAKCVFGVSSFFHVALIDVVLCKDSCIDKTQVIGIYGRQGGQGNAIARLKILEGSHENKKLNFVSCEIFNNESKSKI